MRKKLRTTNSKKAIIICISILLILFAIPSIANMVFIRWEINTAEDLGNVEWLGFWGSYLGGVVGCAAALIALFITFKQQEQHHIDMCETDRLRMLPSINFSVIPIRSQLSEALTTIILQKPKQVTYIIHSEKETMDSCVRKYGEGRRYYMAELKNIGVGPAFGIKIYIESSVENKECAEIGNVGVGDSTTALVFFEDDWSFNLRIEFEDVFKNKYWQSVKVECHGDELNSIDYPSSPMLI